MKIEQFNLDRVPYCTNGSSFEFRERLSRTLEGIEDYDG